VGLEPTLFHSSAWKADAIAAMRYPLNLTALHLSEAFRLAMERLARIELAFSGWRPVFLPLEDNRLIDDKN
jgi:hypothetical protein